MVERLTLRRRELLAGLASTAFWPKAGWAAFAPTSTRSAQWPSEQEWAALERRLSGPLLRPQPLLAPCVGAAASAACKTRLEDLRNPYFLGEQPGGTQVSGWLDAWTPKLSAYAVAAHSADDVAAAIAFARDHRVKLAVKGGGHSYQGTSNAPDSLLVWTRRMRGIDLHDDFTPTGAVSAAGPAVTVEAGCMWLDVYEAVTTRAGRYVQGGGCATVGVAGLVQSGGFGSFSKRFGSAASSLLEAEVVTADGRVRTVNAQRDPELFWALKGGGGGTFGVVTRLTLKTHDLPRWFGSAGATIRAQSDVDFVKLIDRFLAFYADRLLGPAWGESITLRPDNRLEISLVQSGLTQSESEALWRDFFAWARNEQGLSFEEEPDIGVSLARSWWDVETRARQGSTAFVRDKRPGAEPGHGWWSGDQEQVSAFLHGYDSVWLSERLLEPRRRPDLARALFEASRAVPLQLHFNKGLAGAPAEVLGRVKDTATNPDVIQAFALAISATGSAPAFPELGQSLDLNAARRNAEAVKAAGKALRRVAPHSGSYVSESDYFNARWSADFWGPNYSRLLRAKKRYDPAGIFTVHHGVGSEVMMPARYAHAGQRPAIIRPGAA